MDDLTQLLRIIPATEVAKRWHVTDFRLNEIVEKYKLPIYSLREERLRPNDGKTVYFCSGPRFNFYYEGDYGHGHYVLEEEYFNADHVERHESEHQELLWETAPKDEPEYIPAGDLLKEVNLSPTRFVELLRAHRDYLPLHGFLDNDRKFFYNGNVDPVVVSEMLFDKTIHRLDWENFIREMEKEGQTSWALNGEDSLSDDSSDIEAQLAEAKRLCAEAESITRRNNQLLAERAELKEALEEKDARIAELGEELAAARAEPATTVNAAKWESSVAAAFGVWAEIILGDKADWKEEEFRAALVKLCSDYHTTVHDLAWRALPSVFKKGVGRPKKKPGNTQQSDNS